MRPGYYRDKEGSPIDRETFARLFEDMKYRRVARRDHAAVLEEQRKTVLQ